MRRPKNRPVTWLRLIPSVESEPAGPGNNQVRPRRLTISTELYLDVLCADREDRQAQFDLPPGHCVTLPKNAILGTLKKMGGEAFDYLRASATTPTTRGAATSTCGTGRSPSTAKAARPGPSRSATTPPAASTGTSASAPGTPRRPGRSCGSGSAPGVR